MNEPLFRLDSLAQWLLPEFGIFCLNVKDAAELIAIDMWFSGAVETPGLDYGDVEPTDPRLTVALADTTRIFLERLIRAIDKGTLKAEYIRKDFDENLLPEETYLEQSTLEDWLSEHSYEAGDVFLDWHDARTEIVTAVVSEIAALKAVAASGRHAVRHVVGKQNRLLETGGLDEEDHRAVLASLKDVIAENARLKTQLAQTRSTEAAKVDRPLSLRARRTLLTLIAALCGHARVDPSARGAAQRIKEMTERLGFPVDDGTIAKIIAEIPEALESRQG